MRTILALAVASAFLCSIPASADTLASPGEYSMTFVAWSELVPPELIPPGTPAVGPTVFDGTLRINRKGRGFNATFIGDSADGHRLQVRGAFNASWRGVRTELVPINGHLVDAIVHIDHQNLVRGSLNGTVLVDGFTSRVQVRVGPGGALVSLRVR